MKYDIVNIVARSQIESANGNKFKLDEISQALENSEYEPEQFPGVIIHIRPLKYLFFSSGRIICLGARNEQEVKEGLNAFREAINRIVKLRKED